MNKWLKKQALALMLSTAKVQETVLSQKNNKVDDDLKQETNKDVGSLLHGLKNNIINEEVINLRWRTYKVLNNIDNVVKVCVGHEPNGTPIMASVREANKIFLKKQKTEPSDSYELEMVVNNDDIPSGAVDTMIKLISDGEHKPTINKDKNGNAISASHATVSGEFFSAMNKAMKPILIGRTSTPKFGIEEYTVKLHVRTIDAENKLLEFYVSKYPNLENKRTTLFLSDLKKAKANPITSSLLDIKEVGFITHNCLGVDDNLEFKYKITGFNKITDFNEFYVIKFNATVIVNGYDITEKHRSHELDDKYAKKTRKGRK